jgi:peptidyl-prolyl cis-trans isomerase C
VQSKTELSKILTVFMSVLLVVGCSPKPGIVKELPVSAVATQSPTEGPMAARVNGEGILLSDYDAEMQRYQAGMTESGHTYDAAVAKQAVLDMMINQVLLTQAAIKQGYKPDDAALQKKYTELVTAAGSEDAFKTWISKNFYTDDSFHRALAQDMAAVWMRNKILSDVPQTADQVHARQILLKSENEAIAVQRQLQVGKSFESLAFEYDALTGGDLGWFPSGYLLQPDVEKAAFSLQPSQYSAIIQTSYGYHIVYVIERDSQHPLSQEALQFMQRNALEKWLSEQRSSSAVEILVP